MLYTIHDVIEVLEDAERLGAEKDIPEGSRYVQMSDTCVSLIIATLENVADVYEL